MSENHESDRYQKEMLLRRKEKAQEGRVNSKASLLNTLMIKFYSSLYEQSPAQTNVHYEPALRNIPNMIKVMENEFAKIREDSNNNEIDLEEIMVELIKHHERIRGTDRNRHLLYELTRTEFTRMLTVAKMKTVEPDNLEGLFKEKAKIIYGCLIKSEDILPEIEFNQEHKIITTKVNDKNIIEKISIYMLELKIANSNWDSKDDNRLIESLTQVHNEQISQRNQIADLASKKTYIQNFPLTVISKNKFKELLTQASQRCNADYEKYLEQQKRYSHPRNDNPFA